jgi:hypothetical protein
MAYITHHKIYLLRQNPKLVVDAIVDALTDSHPPMWYFPGNAAKVMR